MEKEYDFTNGEKGKFHITPDEIKIPVYLNEKNKDYFMEIARQKNKALSELINEILSKDREIISTVLS